MNRSKTEAKKKRSPNTNDMLSVCCHRVSSSVEQLRWLWAAGRPCLRWSHQLHQVARTCKGDIAKLGLDTKTKQSKTNKPKKLTKQTQTKQLKPNKQHTTTKEIDNALHVVGSAQGTAGKALHSLEQRAAPPHVDKTTSPARQGPSCSRFKCFPWTKMNQMNQALPIHFTKTWPRKPVAFRMWNVPFLLQGLWNVVLQARMHNKLMQPVCQQRHFKQNKGHQRNMELSLPRLKTKISAWT